MGNLKTEHLSVAVRAFGGGPRFKAQIPLSLDYRENFAIDYHARAQKGSAFLVAATLAAQPLAVFGRNVVFPPNPIGMRLYQEHHLMELLALSVVVCALLLGCLFHLAWHKVKSLTPEDAWYYEI